MSDIITIDSNIPDELGWVRTIDKVAWRLKKLAPAMSVNLSLNSTKWLTPIDVISLLLIINEVYSITRTTVYLCDHTSDQESYLQMMGFFNILNEKCKSKVNPNIFWNPGSNAKHVTITEMTKRQDIYDFIEQLVPVLRRFFPGDDLKNYRDMVITVVLEACSNGVDHSSGLTYGLVQSYNGKRKNKVHIAIGDNGIGIRNHLIHKLGDSGLPDCRYIKWALSGTSGRLEERGGNGLRRIYEICNHYSGKFTIRSGQGAIAVLPEDYDVSSYHFFPGTQLSIIL